MFGRLQIYDARERAIVGLADLLAAPLRWRQATDDRGPVGRVLLLRLERIGDLLMVLDAIRDARAAWPAAEIDLAVGSWNASLAALIPDLNRVEVADGRGWLAAAVANPGRRWRDRRAAGAGGDTTLC
jgi:hypothetical protein